MVVSNTLLEIPVESPVSPSRTPVDHVWVFGRSREFKCVCFNVASLVHMEMSSSEDMVFANSDVPGTVSYHSLDASLAR